VARLVKVKTPTLRRRTLQVLLRTAYTFPFSPTQTSNLIFLIKDTSKPRQNRNTVISVSPQYGRMAPANARETRSTLDLTSKTSGGIINEFENAKSSPLQKLTPELINTILELVLTSDDGPIKISKFGRHQMPGILQTSRKIREIGLKMYYNNKDFRALVTNEHPDGPAKWAVEIASDKLRYIRSFTFDFRLAHHDNLLFSKGYQDRARLKQMCENVSREAETSMSKFGDLELDPTKVRLHVNLRRPHGISEPHRKLHNSLRGFLAIPVAELIDVMEALTGPAITTSTTPRYAVQNSIYLGRAMVGPRGCWTLVVV
jgi:hypothetical protein